MRQTRAQRRVKETGDITLNSTPHDLTVPISCDCPWCSYYHSFPDIQDEETHEKLRFLILHNHFVTEQLTTEAMKHADTAQSLKDFLMEKTKRHDEVESVRRVLSLIESSKKDVLRPDILEALFKKLCR